MSFRKWVGLLLVLFVHAFVAEDELSEEFAKFIKKKHPTLASNSSLYKDFKDSYKKIKNYDKKIKNYDKKIKNYDKQIENYDKELCETRKEFHKNYEKMPHAYLMCAMQFMKFEGSKIFYNVTGVGNLKIDTMKQWPARIQKVRIDKDEYNEANPCLMYPSKFNHRAMKKEDDRSYNQWLTFVSQDSYNLAFENKKNTYTERKWPETQENWRTIALYLQGNLTKYYNQLDENVRLERYNNNKNVLLESFSAIIQRGFRLSHYFFHDMQPKLLEELREKYDNGTNIFLETAIKRVHYTWYFPEEHIDMYNILINSTTSNSDDIHHMFPCVNVIICDRPLILPGMDNCGRTGSATTAAFKYLKLTSKPSSEP